jgi:site-specific DNA recombinase
VSISRTFLDNILRKEAIMLWKGKQAPTPRNGHTYVVAIVARISGCQNQKEESLEDQIDHAKAEIAPHVSYPIEYRVIATKGKGEWLVREELAELESLIRSRTLDLIFAEDLGRIVRGAEATDLLGLAKDHGTRVISPNDCIDTDDPDWEKDALEACADHVGYNQHTSKRIKHKMMNRFVKYGMTSAQPIAGYFVPQGADRYDLWQKLPEAEAIIREGYRLLRETGSCAQVADHFNGARLLRGARSRSPRWKGSDVRAYFANPLLKGKPGRGFKHTVKKHETGKRVSVINPDGPRHYHAPHLAFLSEEEFHELNEFLRDRNKEFREGRKKAGNGRTNIPRKRTRFPGQHATCHYCGRSYYWGANGIAKNLSCSGSRDYLCWNSMGFCGAMAARKLVTAILDTLETLDDFEPQFAAMVAEARSSQQGDLPERLESLQRRQALLHQETRHLAERIAATPLDALVALLTEKEKQLRALKTEENALQQRLAAPIDPPDRLGDIRELLRKQFESLAIESPAFGDLLRKLVPHFSVHLVRLPDGGKLFPRARVRLDLASSIRDADRVPGLRELLSRTLTIDLFDPPQRERIRIEACRLKGAGRTQKQIAAEIAERPTATAVGYALALQRLMDDLGLTSPYLFVGEPPANFTKLRRHQRPRYRFEPLDGYQPPEL